MPRYNNGVNRDEFREELLGVMERKQHWAWKQFTTGKVAADRLHVHFEQEYATYVRDFPVLVARIGALLRRAQPAIPPVLRRADLAVDTAQRRARRGDRALDRAPKEFGVLERLLAAQGRTVSAEELLERVWDEHADPFTNAVKITMSRLRAKLGDPPLIETVAKSGYRI